MDAKTHYRLFWLWSQIPDYQHTHVEFCEINQLFLKVSKIVNA